MLGKPPYFDMPFYVGFEAGGHELGLLPATAAGAGSTTYWAVTDIDAAHARLLALGATEREPVTEVGDGIRLSSLVDPMGGVFGIIQNPHAP